MRLIQTDNKRIHATSEISVQKVIEIYRYWYKRSVCIRSLHPSTHTPYCDRIKLICLEEIVSTKHDGKESQQKAHPSMYRAKVVVVM